jgi:hypothetical protein
LLPAAALLAALKARKSKGLTSKPHKSSRKAPSKRRFFADKREELTLQMLLKLDKFLDVETINKTSQKGTGAQVGLSGFVLVVLLDRFQFVIRTGLGMSSLSFIATCIYIGFMCLSFYRCVSVKVSR